MVERQFAKTPASPGPGMHVHQRPGGIRAGNESAARRSAIAVVKGLAWPGGGSTQ